MRLVRSSALALATTTLACSSLVGIEDRQLAPTGTAGSAGAAGSSIAGGNGGKSGESAAAGNAGQATAGAGGSSTAGASGNAGSAGQSGNAGQSGDAGQAGNAGESGNAGQAGNAGESGNAGQAGNAGESGNAGQAGNAGESGNAGQAGNAGESGNAGQAGNAGESGNAGQAGSAGQGGLGGSAGQGGTAGTGGGAGACADSPFSQLVSFWHFDEAPPTPTATPITTLPANAYRDVFARNHGMIMGTTAITPSGHQDGALALSGMGHVSVPHSPSLALAHMTVEAWVRPVGPGPIVSKNTAGEANGVLLDVQQSGKLRFSLAGAAIEAASAVVYDSWIHVVGTYDGTTLRLFVDGAQVSQGFGTGPANAIDNTLALFIGGDHDAITPHRFNGLIDEVRIWKEALTPAQIKAQRDRGTCAVVDALQWDFTNAPAPVQTAPWPVVPPVRQLPGFVGSFSTTFNGAGAETRPFLVRYMDEKDRFPFLTVTPPTGKRFSLDALIVEQLSNWESPDGITIDIEIGPGGGANPAAATGFTTVASFFNPFVSPGAVSVQASAGLVGPAESIIRFRPRVKPSPESGFLGFGNVHVVGTLQ